MTKNNWTYQLKNKLRWNWIRGWLAAQLARRMATLGMVSATGELGAIVLRRDGSRENLGILGRLVVTDVFVQFLVDQLQTESSEIGDFKYHDSGVGTTAEATTDTDIETTDGESRVAGTQVEGASAEIYKSVATISYTTTKAITEHGLFSQSTGGTLMDRTVFSAINVGNGDAIQFTYQLTINSGG